MSSMEPITPSASYGRLVNEDSVPALTGTTPIYDPTSGIFTAPKGILAGRQQEIHAERDRKLEAARKQRQIRRQQAA